MQQPLAPLPLLLVGSLAFALPLASAQSTVTIDLDIFQPDDLFDIVVTGTPGSPQCLFVDTLCVPTDVPGIGLFDLGFSPDLFVIDLPPVPADGSLELPVTLPCDSPFLGIEFCLQAVQLDAVTLELVVTSSDTFIVEDTVGACQNVCVADGSIQGNFNGTEIPTGRTVWFNSIVKIKNPAPAPASYNFTDATITFDACGESVVLDLPDTVISFSPSTTTATTIYDEASDVWVTDVPAGYDGNVFLSGCGFQLPPGLCGDFDDVTWSGQFGSQAGSPEFQWKWAAAVYTDFPEDKNAIGVKPIDGSDDNPFPNSHHAGSPEFFTEFVIGGATGGGGSNFTGSYSGTKTNECQ